MKHIFFLFLLISSFPGRSQPSKPALLHEINQDIWIPFIEGIKQNKAELYVNVHSKDFYWVASGKNSRIMNFDEYDLDSRQVMQQRNQQGGTSELEVRFLDRTIDHEFASEKCVMKFTLHQAGQSPKVSYGITYIFSRKETGKWKMLVQQANVEKANEEIYNRAAALEEVDKI